VRRSVCLSKATDYFYAPRAGSCPHWRRLATVSLLTSDPSRALTCGCYWQSRFLPQRQWQRRFSWHPRAAPAAATTAACINGTTRWPAPTWIHVLARNRQRRPSLLPRDDNDNNHDDVTQSPCPEMMSPSAQGAPLGVDQASNFGAAVLTLQQLGAFLSRPQQQLLSKFKTLPMRSRSRTR
jgi:hypothetical protein